MKIIKSVFILVLISISVYAVNEIRSVKSNDATSSGQNSNVNSQLIISGNILDQKNNETLAGASIYIDGKKIYSDLDGRFTFPVSRPGKYDMKVELISYETTEMQLQIIGSSDLSIALTQK